MIVKKAVAFAEEAHRGAVRKGTTIPYITHPLETAVIVAAMTRDREVIAAAVLHDVVEDAKVSEQELREQFGDRVAALVLAETEDKTKTWIERKSATIEHLKQATIEEKMLVLGDKLSNIRNSARDYLLQGDRFWERFNEKRKEVQGWYYDSVAQGLKDLAQYPEYQEYVELCRMVFHEGGLYSEENGSCEAASSEQ